MTDGSKRDAGGAAGVDFTLAHLSDLHLGPLPPFRFPHWTVKRVLGYLNWQRKRRRIHRHDVSATLISDLKSIGADHIAVTGDLVNIALPAEYIAAGKWLEALGPPHGVSVVPGNHDIYVDLRGEPGVERWASYMRGDGYSSEGPEAHAPSLAGFPYMRRRGAVALIGVNSAKPTPPFVAAGRVANYELERLETMLRQVGTEGLFRCVMIHHPPLPGQVPARRALKNADALADVFSRAGVELVLHGHNHTDTIVWGNSAYGRYPVVGIASASAGLAHHREGLGRYNLIRVRREWGVADDAGSGPWQIEVTGRGFADPGGPVVELDRTILVGPKRGERVEAELDAK